jgi:2-methylcitrate dehydratase
VTFPATTALAAFASSLRLADVPPEAVRRAKLLALDNLGVALAAAPLPLGTKIRAYVSGLDSHGAARLWGVDGSAAPALAALANGTLSSAQDFDAGWHLTTHTFPAAIAAGEHAGASGAAVLEGFIAGYEAGARLIGVVDSARAAGAGMTARGWYHVGFVGPLASALAAGKVLGLDPGQLRGALGTAAATSGGVRRNFGTMAKAYQAGNAAMQGVQAALLATSGFAGDLDVLEAPLGLLAALDVPDGQAEREIGRLGHDWELLASLKIKRFPACTPAHQPVQLALELQRQHGFAAAEVEAIEADLHTFSLLRLNPADEVAAGFSLPYLLAVALLDGELTLSQMDDQRVHDPAVRRLMAAVHSAGDSYPSGAEDHPEHLVIRLRDGRVIEGETRRVARLDTPENIVDKFRNCAVRTLPAEGVQELEQLVMSMDTLPSIRRLTAATHS